MFRDAFRIVFEFVGEIETAIGRQFIKDPDLAFAGLERGADVILRKILQRSPRSLSRLAAPAREICHRVNSRAYSPLSQVHLSGIECGIPADDLVQIEKPHDFFDLDLFAIVLRRPTEQAKIIAHRLRQIAALECR